MTEPWEAAGRWTPAQDWTPPRRTAQAPAPTRSRRPLLIAIGVAGLWVLLYLVTGSLIGATALLMLLALLGVAIMLSLRSLGIDRDHPRVRQMTALWSDGRDRLRSNGPVSDRLSSDTPSSREPSPDRPSSRGLSPDEPSFRGPSSHGPSPDVSSSRRPSPAGQAQDWEPQEWSAEDWSPKQRSPQQHQPLPDWSPMTGCSVPYAEAMGTRLEQRSPLAGGLMTVAEPVVPVIPVLTLITSGSVAQTRRSGARAGRGEVDLVLPQVATVSREHAKFTYADGQWWVANLGRNGLTVNGAPLSDGGHPLQNGDSIRWGMRPDALVSRVEIGGPSRT
jgi:hypothetical protein